ncbi:cytochrome c oxidase subunit 4 [Streptomyces sp. DT24]|uniref:aa3-type cytochrome oxidase subunit IV n=1 Tax=unclassified Streptomyces TaxID=2593676 RepID=UPI0023B99DA8|nr:cytochrome c oxidase subunit 4 [Streptomyces sp. AM 4-1-1]WEH36674.1 cytochrome c oxidase subunit 4 [Streptomyces sp. AM 4-1-1]
MRAEALLFSGVALFFALTGGIYGWLAREPAGLAALTVSFLMSALIAAFLWRQHGRTLRRPEDRKDAEIRENSGTRTFFPARSYFPVLAGLGTALIGSGVAIGLWLFLIGVGVLIPGVFGFVYANGPRTD